MKEKTLGIILTGLNTVLLVVCGILFLGKDKTSPEIFLSAGSVVYAEEAGEQELFRGVTAFDEEDGELTDQVVIEKIVTDREKETATITYGVVDSAGNVGKATCTVEMIVEEENVSEEGTEGTEVLEEDVSGENSVEEEAESEEEESEETEAESEEEGSEENDPEEGSEEEGSEENDPEEGSEEEESEGTDSEEAEEEATVQNVSSNPNPGRPSIVFRSQEVKTKAGQTPAWINVIEGLHDDKDNYETLLKSLKVNGDYDKAKAGTYNVTVTVTDGEGNESNAYPMKIVVEAWE